MPSGRRSLDPAHPAPTAPRGHRLRRSLTAPRPRVWGVTGAVAVTATAVAVGVAGPFPGSEAESAPRATASIADAAAIADLVDEDRSVGTSRSVVRRPALELRVPDVSGRLWTTAPLKLRAEPREGARSVGVFPEDKRIGVTGERRDGFAQVVVDDAARWVSAAYLSKKREKDEPEAAPSSSSSGGSSSSSGIDTGPCSNGAVASGGLQPQAQTVMNAVCNAFPDITTYGGAAGRGEHGTGLAVDIMVSGARGEQVKQFLYANRGQFGLSNIIYAQTIWSAERDGEGFRGMEDRGSSTANHYDHVHVLVN